MKRAEKLSDGERRYNTVQRAQKRYEPTTNDREILSGAKKNRFDDVPTNTVYCTGANPPANGFTSLSTLVIGSA